MKKFEYLTISIMGWGAKTTRVLNEYGQKGWELVDVWSIWHYLKREIKETATVQGEEK